MESKIENTWGNADIYENKRLAKKAIRKDMKTKDEQIGGREGTVYKSMKTKERQNQGQVNQEERWRKHCGWRLRLVIG